MSYVSDAVEKWGDQPVTVLMAVQDADRLLASIPLAGADIVDGGVSTNHPEQAARSEVVLQLRLCAPTAAPERPTTQVTPGMDEGAQGGLTLALSVVEGHLSMDLGSGPADNTSAASGADLPEAPAWPGPTLEVHALVSLTNSHAQCRSTTFPGHAHSQCEVLPVLTHRERQVLTSLATGEPIKKISRVLGISVHTCRGYVKSLHSKLSVSSQLEMVVKAQKLGLVDDHDDLDELVAVHQTPGLTPALMMAGEGRPPVDRPFSSA